MKDLVDIAAFLAVVFIIQDLLRTEPIETRHLVFAAFLLWIIWLVHRSLSETLRGD
mgnify:CR=1 FL=1